MTEQSGDDDSSLDGIVAFSEHRPHEIADPLSELPTESAVVTIETSVYSLRRYVRATVEAVRALRDVGPEVLLADHFGPLTSLAVVLGKLSRTPVFVRSGGNSLAVKREHIADCLDDRAALALILHVVHLLNMQVVSSLADGYVAVSESLADELADEFVCEPERVLVVPVPARGDRTDGSATAARRRHGIEASTVVLTVTNLKYREKFEALEQMAPGVLGVIQDDPDVAWVVAGGGEYQQSLGETVEGFIESDDVGGRVHIPGFVEEIADLYALADVFVYFSDVDAYPNVVLEAQANELPVVANPDHGIVEQIDDGSAGVPIPLGEVDALETALEELIADPQRRDEFGRQGFERVSRENSPEAVGALMEEALEGVLYSEE